MITTDGRLHLKRYFAGHVPTIAQAIAFGIGGKAEAVGDTTLQFEVGRVDVSLTSYDFVNDRLIFKGLLPASFSGTIYEVGIYSQFENPLAGGFSSKLLTSFDSDSEVWSTTAYTTANARVGGDSLSHTPAASASTSSVLNDIFMDLSGNSGADRFSMAYNVAGTLPATVVFRFRTDASNYYSFSMPTPAAGYRVDQFIKGNATVTGTPNWANITSIEVVTTAGAGGAAAVDFDGIRIEDTDTVNPEYVMVSRDLLTVPYVKQEGKVQEIEFALGVSVA